MTDSASPLAARATDRPGCASRPWARPSTLRSRRGSPSWACWTPRQPRQRARRSYEAHARLLRDWNAAINLTAIREPADDRPAARLRLAQRRAPRLTELVAPGAILLDIGSGGGYPGLPLAAALPLSRVGLLDSVGKKARFLGVAGAAVGRHPGRGRARTGAATDIEAIAERAEDLAEEPDHRGAWDIVTTRAVGSLAEVVELSLPLTREGGSVVAWKREEERGGLRAELRDAGSIIRAAGGGRPEVVDVEAPSLPGPSAGHRAQGTAHARQLPAPGRRAQATQALSGDAHRAAGRRMAWLAARSRPATLAPMRVAVLSDIHSNLPALEAALEAVGPFDQLWVLGDIVGYGPHPDEVVERLRDAGRRRGAGQPRRRRRWAASRPAPSTTWPGPRWTGPQRP